MLSWNLDTPYICRACDRSWRQPSICMFSLSVGMTQRVTQLLWHGVGHQTKPPTHRNGEVQFRLASFSCPPVAVVFFSSSWRSWPGIYMQRLGTPHSTLHRYTALAKTSSSTKRRGHLFFSLDQKARPLLVLWANSSSDWGLHLWPPMEKSSNLPLLEKKCHSGCPGCAYGQKKDLQDGIPYKEFLYGSCMSGSSAFLLVWIGIPSSQQPASIFS